MERRKYAVTCDTLRATRIRRATRAAPPDLRPLPSLADLRPFFAGEQRDPPQRDEHGARNDNTFDQRGAGGLPVLVIEDNRDTADLLRLLLEDVGYPAKVAHAGIEGLELAKALRPHIVLLDLRLPDINGYSVARQLREFLRPDNVLLIALTGLPRDRERELAHGARFDHYLTKPVPFEAVRSLLPVTSLK